MLLMAVKLTIEMTHDMCRLSLKTMLTQLGVNFIFKNQNHLLTSFVSTDLYTSDPSIVVRKCQDFIINEQNKPITFDALNLYFVTFAQ